MHFFEILIMMFLSLAMVFLITKKGERSYSSKLSFDEWSFLFFLLLTIILFIAAVIVAIFGL